MKTLVLDTNVLVHDPDALHSFHDVNLVIPIIVIEELDNLKKLEGEKGHNIRTAIRSIDSARQLGNIIEGVSLPNNTKLRVSVLRELPSDLSNPKPDNYIIGTAFELQEKGENVVFISKDLNARIKAAALGIKVEDYEKKKVALSSLYHGWSELLVSENVIADFRKYKFVEIDHIGIEHEFFVNEYVLFKANNSPTNTAIGKYEHTSKRIYPLKYADPEMWGIKPINLEQHFVCDLLLDDSISLVTIVGQAGTGKTLLAIAAALQKVVDDKVFKKIMVSRPIVPMGKDIGYLPGSKKEKLSHWMAPVYDNLNFIMSNTEDEDETASTKIAYLEDKDYLELEAVTYIRGRSLPQQFYIVDEAQNLTPHEIKTIVSRMGKDSKLVITGDPYQIDNPYLDSDSNGLTYVAEKFKDQSIAGHITLTKSERSQLAGLAAELL